MIQIFDFSIFVQKFPAPRSTRSKQCDDVRFEIYFGKIEKILTEFSEGFLERSEK